MPILDGLEITAKTAGNMVIKDAIMQARAIDPRRRDDRRAAAGNSGVFPPMVVQMITVGEETGALDEMLTKIADFYDDEVDTSVEALTSRHRAGHDRLHGRHRRRHGRRDVPADLQDGQRHRRLIATCSSENGEPGTGARAGRSVPACLVASGVLVAFLATARLTGVLGISPVASIALLGGTSLLVALRALGVAKVLSLDTLVGTHLVVQFALTTVLVAFTGGIASPFAPLYVLPVFAGALFRDTRGGVLFAVASILVLAIFGVRLGSGIVLALAGHAGAFFAVAALAGHLGRETRRLDERAIETSEEMARVLAATERVLESVPVGIVIATPTGRITRMNRAAAATLALGDPAEIAGVDLRESLGAIAPQLVDAFDSAAATGKWAVREEVMLGQGPERASGRRGDHTASRGGRRVRGRGGGHHRPPRAARDGARDAPLRAAGHAR